MVTTAFDMKIVSKKFKTDLSIDLKCQMNSDKDFREEIFKKKERVIAYTEKEYQAIDSQVKEGSRLHYTIEKRINQSVESAGVAFVKAIIKRN